MPGPQFLPHMLPDHRGLVTEIQAVVRTEMRSAGIAPMESTRSAFGWAIDSYRALFDEGFPRKAARQFERLLDEARTSLGPVDVFRIKVNLGLCYWLLDDTAGAARWIEEGCDAAPHEPRAVANRALVLLLRGQNREAFEYAQQQLVTNPENEWLASQLYRVALHLPEMDEPFDLIPSKLRHSESVLLLRTLFLRNRWVRPKWWEVATDARDRFPENRTLALFAAEAVVDRNIIANEKGGRLTVGEPERSLVAKSVPVLQTSWERIKASENPESEEGDGVLNTLMMARRLLGDREGALNIARDFIQRSRDEKLLTNAVQIAFGFEDAKLAKAGLTVLPAGGKYDFYRGMFAFNCGEWAAAAEHFKQAECPDEERPLVNAITRLAAVADPRSSIGADGLKALGDGDEGDPRIPTILGQLARRRGFPELAKISLNRALALLRPDSPMPWRIMAASFAQEESEFGAVIDILSGHVDLTILSEEFLWLAEAHASEVPRKARNLRFFEHLGREIRGTDGIARAYATVLLDTGRHADAERVFRRVVVSLPRDVYSHLRLVEALRRQKNDSAALKLIRSADERLFVEQPLHSISWAVELREADQTERALALAYELLRKYPDKPKIALGYVGLIIGSKKAEFIPRNEDLRR
jgi:cellulose synthase operon protein C